MTPAVLDDHLLRDLLAGRPSKGLAGVLRRHTPATTNLYLYRLCRSAASAGGGALTGAWTAARRRALAARLLEVSDEIEIVPMRSLAFRMASISADARVSTLGAEALAAAELLGAPLVVWEGDVGSGIKAGARELGIRYTTVSR